MSHAVLPSLVIVGLGLLVSGCVWRTSEPSAPRAEAEPAAASPQDGVEEIAPGITQRIGVTPDGDELVQLNVDLDVAEVEPPTELETLPRPFDAAAIATGLPLGAELVFAIASSRAGDATVTWRVTGHEADSVQITYEAQVADGTVQPPQVEDLPWAQLEEHASFPAAFSTRREAPITVQAGTFDAWVYEVRPPETTPPVVETFYFAKNLPGPPILHVVTEGEEQVHRMELLSHSSAK